MSITLDRKRQEQQEQGWENASTPPPASPTNVFNRAGLLHVYDAPSIVPDMPAAPSGEKKMAPDDRRLKDRSGYYADNTQIVGYAGGYDRYGSGGDDGSAQEEDAEKKARKFLQGLGSLFLNEKDISSYLNRKIVMDQAWLHLNGMNMHEITDKDMLRDEKGNIVRTVEEKRRIEEKNKICSAQFAQDEVTMDENGKLVSREQYEMRNRLQDSIAENKDVLAQLEAGKLKPEDVPEHIKDAAAKQKSEAANPQAQAAAPDQPVSILDQIRGPQVAAQAVAPAWTPRPAGP